MVFMPPRHGKSELVSRLFAGYYAYVHSDRWVGVNSYGAELAYTLSRAARQFFERVGGQVADDASAVKHWETTSGGGLWAAGVGGPITGKGFHLGIIDDPLKNAEEAASEAIRAKHKEWYSSTFYTRGEPGNAIVVVQTRWHEDDLSGWLLAEEHDGELCESWHVLSMPAIKEDEERPFPASCTVELDDRKPGEPLCPERYPLDKLLKIRRRVGAYFWSALFQQNPKPPGGLIFRSFPTIEAIPPGSTFVRYWDKAGSQGKGDWSVGCLMAVTLDGRYIVADIVRGQWSAANREAIIKSTAALDGPYTQVWVEQEPGSGGKESAETTVISLAGYVVQIDRVTGDKESRARPLAAQAEIGNVYIVRADWNQAFVTELQAFPNGRHDDQVDAASGAFNKLTLSPRPMLGVAIRHSSPPPVPMATTSIPAGIPDAFNPRGMPIDAIF